MISVDKNQISISGACATAHARNGIYACTHTRVLYGWRGSPYCKSDVFFFFTLSLGPLEAKIQVFSDGLSENDRKSINERVHKFCSSALVFAGTAIFFLPAWQDVTGAYSERFSEIIGNRKHPENTLKKQFLSKKVLKEGERVARGHFHERVGESPRRYENFGTSGSSVAFFVSEIQPFENCLGSKSTFK